MSYPIIRSGYKVEKSDGTRTEKEISEIQNLREDGVLETMIDRITTHTTDNEDLSKTITIERSRVFKEKIEKVVGNKIETHISITIDTIEETNTTYELVDNLNDLNIDC